MPHPRTCSVEDCNNKHRALGYCQYHYQQLPETKQRNVEWARNNPKRMRTYRAKYRSANKEKHAVTQARLRKNVQYRLADSLRKRLWNVLRDNKTALYAINNIGCTSKELQQYLEAQFVDGMNWDNWSRDGWHIDHIVPLASFDLTDRDQLLKATHFTNLQPLWAKENLSKGSKIK